MTWKENSIMNERMKFITKLELGERMSDLCKEFSISRKTGYKLWNRYEEKGVNGLFDESRKPISNPNITPSNVENLILRLKGKHRTWGAGKLRAYLINKHSGLVFPSKNTFHNILAKHDLVKRRSRRRLFKMTGTNLKPSSHANDLWCADFKGQFKMGNKIYCYPLTITDHKSRYIIACVALESTQEGGVFAAFEAAFEQFGLPKAIRTDNGIPFSSSSILGFSKLSVWWMRLGIEVERIHPGCPQENGRHERMHLTLKRDVLHNPAPNLLKQQEIFDYFIEVFNKKRPHEALNNKTPLSEYIKSSSKLPKRLKSLDYEECDMVRVVNLHGRLYIEKRFGAIHIGQALVKQPIGITQVDEETYRLQFMDIILGHYSIKDRRFSKMTEIVRI